VEWTIKHLEKKSIVITLPKTSDAESLYPFIEKVGHSPLPPYIDRESVPSDKTYYQTVYASERGSVAAPTAGIHFSKAVLNKMEKKGVKLAYVTLHNRAECSQPNMKSHIG
jgi:S-adenosylmethionine:tRNA ribosyltransferase-isomerase